MRKDARKTSKPDRTKKTAVKDLSPREPKSVKGGKVSVSDMSIMKTTDKSTAVLFQ